MRILAGILSQVSNVTPGPFVKNILVPTWLEGDWSLSFLIPAMSASKAFDKFQNFYDNLIV